MVCITFYGSQEFVDVDWAKFKKLAWVDGSYSKVLRVFVQEYNREHDPGNPQRSLLVYTGQAKQADPFGCGNVKVIGLGGNTVKCMLFGVGVQPKSFCEKSCRFNKVRKEGK